MTEAEIKAEDAALGARMHSVPALGNVADLASEGMADEVHKQLIDGAKKNVTGN